MPFGCAICQEEFDEPVETPCGHFFCEECALAQDRMKPECFLCGKPTNSTFKVSKKLETRIKQRQVTERLANELAEKEQASLAAGEKADLK